LNVPSCINLSSEKKIGCIKEFIEKLFSMKSGSEHLIIKMRFIIREFKKLLFSSSEKKILVE